MKRFDLVDKGNRIEKMSFGFLEHVCELVPTKETSIKCVIVRAKNGNPVMLRYECNPHLIDPAIERIESYIASNYFEMEF